MSNSHRQKAARTAAVGLLCALLLWGVCLQHTVKLTTYARSQVPRGSPSTAALLESRRHWIHAWNAVGKEQSQLEAWDPAAAAGSSWSWEQDLVSRRPELRLAQQSAQRALALSQSKPETYRSVRWLARIECALDHHREELRLAKKLVSLAPRDEGSLTCLAQAAKCNGLTELEKQAITALKGQQTSLAAGAEPPGSTRGWGKADTADLGSPSYGPAGRGLQR